MSRITKEIAKYVAGKLTDKHKKEIEKVHNELKEMAYDAYSKKIPKDVLLAFEKNKSWMYKCESIRAVGNGFNHEYLYLSKQLPSKDGSYVTVQFDEKTSDKLRKHKNLLNSLNKKQEDLFDEIETALIRLGTFKKVEAEFKEAYIHLPKTVSQALVVNIDKIREKL